MRKIAFGFLVAFLLSMGVSTASADWSWGGGNGGSGYDPSWSCYFGWC